MKGTETVDAGAFAVPLESASAGEWERAFESLGLTRQQRRIVELILEGKADKQIARELGISFGTLRSHLNRASNRTGAHGRMEIARLVFTRAMELRSGKERQKK